MEKVLRENKVFLLLYSILFLLVGIVLFSMTKGDIHLFLNKFHMPIADVFFKTITHIGDGLFVAFLCVIFLLISFRKAFIIGFSGIIAGIFAQTLKRLLFSDVVRPKAYFSGIADLYFVPGVDVHTTLSLPSGHTTSAFALFFVLASFVSVNTKNKNSWLIILFMAATLIAYSRIYLSQHFLIDVYLGSFLGVLAGCISVYLLNLPESKWLDKSLIKLKNK